MKTMYVPVAVAEDGTFEVDGVKHQITVVSPPEEKPKWVRSGSSNTMGIPVDRVYPVYRDGLSGTTYEIILPDGTHDFIHKHRTVPATQLEWLTQEARDRGFKKGVRFRSIFSNGLFFECKSDNFIIQEDKLYCAGDGGIIHNIDTDQWAEIIPEDVKFEKGKWYQGVHYEGMMVLCSDPKDNDKYFFSGMCNTNAEYREDWSKDCFTPVDVEITVKGGSK